MTPGLRWLSCYDTSGEAKGTSLTAADGDYNAVAGCVVSASDTGKIWDDDDQYTPEDCCNGWFHEDDCTPADFCYNTLLMCEWEVCKTPMEVFGLANGECRSFKHGRLFGSSTHLRPTCSLPCKVL